jgi:signal transduction histidine kinase
MTEAAVERLQAIHAIVDIGFGPLGRDETLRKLLDRSCSVLAVDKAILFTRTDDNNQFMALASHGCAAAEDLQISLPDSLLEQLASRMQPMVLESIAQIGQLSRVLTKDDGSAMVAPLLADGVLSGIVAVAGHQPGQFSDEHLYLLQLVASRAASVIEHARLFEQVRAGRERSQVLSQQLMEAQEAERRHLARELHDEIGQALTAIKINLQAVQRSVQETATSARLEDSIGIVDRVLQQVRNMSLDLRPSLLDDLGLAAALRWYLDRQAKRAGFAAEFSAEPADIRAASNLETACFRVAQEALTNVVRHAQARRVRAELRRRDNELQLTIQDDGVGFDVPAARQRAARGGSLGLLGMQERVLLIGGRIDIDSAAGRGTSILVRFPLAALPSLERRKRRRDA